MKPEWPICSPIWMRFGSGSTEGRLMSERLRIAQVVPIAGPISRESGGSIEQLAWLLTEELVRRGHDVTLFATGESQTSAALHALYARDYNHDHDLWDWRFH